MLNNIYEKKKIRFLKQRYVYMCEKAEKEYKRCPVLCKTVFSYAKMLKKNSKLYTQQKVSFFLN